MKNLFFAIALFAFTSGGIAQNAIAASASPASKSYVCTSDKGDKGDKKSKDKACCKKEGEASDKACAKKGKSDKSCSMMKEGASGKSGKKDCCMSKKAEAKADVKDEHEGHDHSKHQ